MKIIKVSAPGKLHLLGEHSVVYGKPAIIAAVDKRCYAEIIPRKDNVIEIVSKNLNVSEKLDESKIITKTQHARKRWQEYSKTNNASILKSITTEILDYPIIIIGETLLSYKKPLLTGFSLVIDSQIPIGSGMGSSAALAVSTAGALSLFLGEKLNKDTINSIAFFSEQKKHGLPSGGDNAASCYGGLLWYRKETPELRLIQQLPFILSKSIREGFFISNTGIPDESTGEMVSMINTLYRQNPLFCEKIFTNQEQLVRTLVSALKNGNGNEVNQIIKNGEANLEKLGVVSAFAQAIIRKIERTGGVAKICGAGGKQHAAGIILGFHKNPGAAYEFAFEKIILGTEGLRKEIN